jgi:hypothetical protein
MIHWKLNRLKAMGPAEVCSRVRQTIAARLESWGIGLARGANMVIGTTGAAWASPLPTDFDAQVYVEAADRILAGRWDIFSLRDCHLGFPPRWNRDPKTGVEAPLDFGKGIDYRNEKIVGDIKYLWEPNRHLELVTLAQAWHFTGEPRFAEGARCLLSSWFDQCPYPRGPQWTSSLELGLRLLNWACAWHLLGGEASSLFAAMDGQAFRRRWLCAIHQHCHFISGYLSRHSSANNHLFGELTGLFVAALTWPLWPASERWRERARRELEVEAMKQVASDGTNREQAFWYHHEVADMMLLCLLFGRANGSIFSDQFLKRFESMVDFIAAVMNSGGRVPMVGDADDAVMVRFSQEPGFSPYRSLLATGAVLFGRSDFKTQAGCLDDKSRWLLGDEAKERFDNLPAAIAQPPKRAFFEGGYYVLGQDFGSSHEIKAVVDAGPLGYLSIAAHGHADALSFTLSAGGRELLVDPGTYAYHTQEKWRDYFRGTFAHNTLRVDGVDQSVIGGNFLWLRKANAHCEVAELEGMRQTFRGWHDGYQRLADPVTHRREIVYDAESNSFEVGDTLHCAGRHRVDLCWHFAEDCIVHREEGEIVAHSGPVRLTLTMAGNRLVPTLLRGEEEPPGGWISRTFGIKTSTTTLVWQGEVIKTTKLITNITLAFESGPN